jgi:hypothetical protein
VRLHRRIAGEAQRFRALLEDPRAVQARVLDAILDANRDCEYGRRYGFDAAGYRRRVPLVRYEDLVPSIERMAAGEGGVLTAAPVVAFEETGGTSGSRKLVPYTQAALEGFRRGLLPWLDDLLRSHPALAGGTAYWSISPAARAPRTTAGDVPIGLPDAAYFGTELAADLAAWLSVPPSVAQVQDIDEWRRLTLSHLLADKALSLISVWSPTFLLELLRDAEADFPNLRVISCWDQAAARPYADELRRAFPGVEVQGKGLLATEGLSSIPLHGLPLPVLALESGFFEFLDAGGGVRLAHEVENGAEYVLVLSNFSGMYRYVTGDRVRVHGFAGKTPMLEFLGRAGLVGDLCGEKLTEEFVLRALGGLGLRFAALAAEAAPARGYVLLVDAEEAARTEELAARLERLLSANPQYAYARRLGQLAPLHAVRCAQPSRAWLRAGLRRGQRLGDVKPPSLYLGGDWRDAFGALP